MRVRDYNSLRGFLRGLREPSKGSTGCYKGILIWESVAIHS